VHERGDCRTCQGFEGREVREYQNDRYLVKCFEKRKNCHWYSILPIESCLIADWCKAFSCRYLVWCLRILQDEG
jgi:hypothetical protein